MFLTNILLKKAKSKLLLVLTESVVSGHTKHMIRERTADKIEVIKFDPYIQTMAIYKEKKKIRGVG
ncbi:39S ribosomal protein L33, mitochondrial [Vespa velutina]|uniref:39S ribosomal protein L33, mitochondrial n=1 Tax=Vespa crabro TaxID=7445 RepID=UPI001F01C629|nr:39S ribosomal protein L33, mitochondrial [Vespa crabro]XP_047357433.1 39S ribosomal protein L33, mitochondrial [Vespa velutina]